jgi:hypothetical protein
MKTTGGFLAVVERFDFLLEDEMAGARRGDCHS